MSHSGAFALGTGTTFSSLPGAGLGVVVLTNGSANGLAESVAADFMDLAQFGEIRQDWWKLYSASLGSLSDPVGELVGQSPRRMPLPPVRSRSTRATTPTSTSGRPGSRSSETRSS